MKTKTAEYQNLIPFGNFFCRIATAIVSGLPCEKVVFKPESNTILQIRKESLKSDSEKHYHRPMAKPAVERQTLLKEKKKLKKK